MGYHSCGQSWGVFILSCILLLFSLSSKFQLASCNKETKGEEEGKVTLSLYYETLCPYCANFIVDELVKVFETDLISIVNLRLVPWGNARISNNSFACQHGPDECILNMVDACAINAWPDPKIHFKFIYCVEHLHLEDKHNEWQSCFEKTGLSSEPIRNCFEKQLEVRLELEYADETAQLDPPHAYVPWVLVNDQPLQGDYQNFVAYICRAYKGDVIPKACNTELSTASSEMANSKFNNPNVCHYKGLF